MNSRALRSFIGAGLLLIALTHCSTQKRPTPLATSSSSVTSPSPSVTPSPIGSPSPNANTSPLITATSTALPTLMLRARRSGSTLVSIAVVQGKRRLYSIDADANESVRTTDGAYHSTFTKPQVTFFNQDGTKMHATSEKAEVDGKSKVVIMLGNVLLASQDGTTLRCERLHYDNVHNAVEAWTNVVVTTRQGDTLRGEHLTSDLHLQTVHLDGVDQGT